MLICAAVLFCDSDISNPYQTLPTDQTPAPKRPRPPQFRRDCQQRGKPRSQISSPRTDPAAVRPPARPRETRPSVAILVTLLGDTAEMAAGGAKKPIALHSSRKQPYAPVRIAVDLKIGNVIGLRRVVGVVCPSTTTIDTRGTESPHAVPIF